jgi:hypothetical protein
MNFSIRKFFIKFRQHAAYGFLLGIVIFLSGCAAPAMRNQFRNYNEAYADSLNQQMLLNLARLENGHPAYYLAIGAIDQKYTFSSSTAAGTTGTFQDAKTTTQNNPIGGATPSIIGRVFSTVLTSIFGFNFNETVSASSSPEFQFIPINSDTAAKQVLEPISPEVFLQLYQQGYPIDQLMRIMIERIETPPLPDGEKLILVNSPTRSTPVSYARFLRTCAILRTLQVHGQLLLQARADKQLIGPVSFGSSSQSSQSDTNGPGQTSRTKGNDGADKENNYPALKDFTDAEAKGMILTTNENKGWEIYRDRAVPKFFLGAGQETITTTFETTDQQRQEYITKLANTTIEFLETNRSKGINDYGSSDYEAITNVVWLLCKGIAIQTAVGDGDATATRLVLRSFNRAMEAVASEQPGFEALVKNNSGDFTNTVPDSERRPILKMLWSDYHGTNGLATPLQSIQYVGKTYQITDPVLDPLDPAATWNRNVFCLMVDLSSQVTVDISKFQRQVLELDQ